MSAPSANHLAETAEEGLQDLADESQRVSSSRSLGFGRSFVAWWCLIWLLAASLPAIAQETPDARAILKTVRLNQAAQNRALHGALRTAGRTIPFRLVSTGSTIRYEFAEPPLTLQLRLGEKDSRLEEVAKGSAEKVTPARFDTRVRDTDLSYEDLSLHFLYWRNAAVEGEQTMVLQKCWIVRVEPDARGDSQYSKVLLWIGKNNGALMQAEAYDGNGKLTRKFKVISGQKTEEGLWILKEMRIESIAPGASADRTPTYLEIDGVEK